MDVLFINACVRGKEESRTWKLASRFLSALKREPDVTVSEIDLTAVNLTPMTKEWIDMRDRAAKEGDFSDSFFDHAKRFARADRIVAAAPLWDMSFPAILKVYLENICVCGITFHYTEHGSEGLCRADKLMYITTRGGDFSLPYMQGLEQAFPYMKAVAALLGIGETDCVCAEGLDIIGRDVEKIMEEAGRKAEEKAVWFLK